MFNENITYNIFIRSGAFGSSAKLKHKKNRATDQADIERLTEEIKMRQHQALFYIEKMENVNKSIKESNEQR